MRTSIVSRYAFRLSFGQQSAAESLPSSGSPDRVITRSATCLALFGIALSSFSLKQMLATSSKKSAITLRKF